MKALSATLGFAAAAALVLGASAALAEVDVTADVDKDKTKYVTETITIEKTITITPTVTINVDAAVENEIVKNQDQWFQHSSVTQATSSAEITDSVNDTENGSPSNGVLHFNQTPGNLNNQANDVSIAAAGSLEEDGPGTLAHSEVSIEQLIVLSTADGAGGDSNDYLTNSTLIGDSFVDAEGIIGVNQGAGDMNNQQNAVGMALANEAVLSLGEVDLGQTITSSTVDLQATWRTDQVLGDDGGGAFSGAAGVVGVNQASGYLNNQANAVNVAVGTNVLD